MDFLLIEDEFKNKNWYLNVIDINSLIYSSDMFHDIMCQKYVMESDSGLTIEMINKFIKAFNEKIYNWLNEGKVVLFNKRGGCFFLTSQMTILKKVASGNFPIDTNLKGVSGWLDSKGGFHQCDYGEHHILANKYHKDDKELLIPISHCELDIKSSYIFIDKDKITDLQKNWFKENINILDNTQIKILKEYSIL